MKILVITHRPPFPQNGGYPIVIGNTIRGCVALGHQVSLFSLNPRRNSQHPAATNSYDDELIKQINYRVIPVDISISIGQAVANIFGRRAKNVERFYSQAFERALVNEIKINDYDIVQFEGLFVATYLPALRKISKAKLIYRAHHIEHQVWQRLAAQKRDPFKRFYLSQIAKRIKNYEVQQLNNFDAIGAFTEQDKRSMLYYGARVPVEILPVGVNVEQYRCNPDKIEFPSLFFLGSLDWMPNREGIEWFLDNFYTSLANGELNVRLYVAGNDIPERFDDYEVMGKIYIQGEVDDALEFVNSKAIMIVPLLSGGGMRVKIVEGMAMQKCIISTALGAEGIAYEHGKNILIANTAEEFARAIRRCIADEQYCKTIGHNARLLVEQQHNINVVTQKLLGFYEQVLAAKS